MISQGFLVKDPQYASLQLTPSGKYLLKGHGEVFLAKPVQPQPSRQKRIETISRSTSSDDVDLSLFEHLRKLRREIALKQNVPPFIIFSDVTLQEMARLKPLTLAEFRHIKGVGETKLKTLCPQFLEEIQKQSLNQHSLVGIKN